MNVQYVKDNLDKKYRLIHTSKSYLRKHVDPQKTPLKFECIEHGILFSSSWRAVRNLNGCFVCTGGRTVEMIMGSKLSEITGRPITYAGDTSNPKARIKAGEYIPIICDVCDHGDTQKGHDDWIRPIAQLTIYGKNNGHGCPKCWGIRSSREQRFDVKCYRKAFHGKFGDSYSFDEDSYKRIGEKCTFTHELNNCGIQFELNAGVMLHLASQPCPACHGGKIQNKCSDEQQLDEVIKQHSGGKYTLAKRFKNSYTIKCNRCDDPETYEKNFAYLHRIEHCRTCWSNRPAKKIAFKEQEATELLFRRKLRVGHGKAISSYKKKNTLYSISTGEIVKRRTGILQLLDDEVKEQLPPLVKHTNANRHKAIWSEKECQLVLKYSKEGYRTREIARCLNRTRDSVYGQICKLRKKGIIVENHDTKNESYFSKLTIENCYIAGLLASDGWITAKPSRVRITLKAIDELVLKNIFIAAEVRKSDGSMKNLSYGFSKKYGGLYATLTVGKSKQWNKDLFTHFSITPKKSDTLKPPSAKLTENQTIAYLAGLIEGDGSVSVHGTISWCSNSHLLVDWFIDTVENLTGTSPYCTQRSKKSKRSKNDARGIHQVYLRKEGSKALYKKISKLKATKMSRKWSRMK